MTSLVRENLPQAIFLPQTMFWVTGSGPILNLDGPIRANRFVDSRGSSDSCESLGHLRS